MNAVMALMPTAHLGAYLPFPYAKKHFFKVTGKYSAEKLIGVHFIYVGSAFSQWWQQPCWQG